MPVFSNYEWQFSGACTDADPTVFFHPDGERGPLRRRRDARALALCAVCPVVPACRAHALSVREPYGVWGGLSENDREAIYTQDGSAESRRTGAPASSACLPAAARTPSHQPPPDG
jgi:WhiB family redox-sensing transcriptional regulator